MEQTIDLIETIVESINDGITETMIENNNNENNDDALSSCSSEYNFNMNFYPPVVEFLADLIKNNEDEPIISKPVKELYDMLITHHLQSYRPLAYPSMTRFSLELQKMRGFKKTRSTYRYYDVNVQMLKEYLNEKYDISL